jgi:hypothetical protein
VAEELNNFSIYDESVMSVSTKTISSNSGNTLLFIDVNKESQREFIVSFTVSIIFTSASTVLSIFSGIFPPTIMS